MTLSAGDPWATVLTSQAARWAVGLEQTHPELGPVTVAVEGATVTISASCAIDGWAAVWLLVREVAPWWPGWLHPAGVGCCVITAGVTVLADADAMFDLAATIALG